MISHQIVYMDFSMVLLMKCELRIVREIQNNDLVARKDCKMTSLATASARMITSDMSSLVFPCCAPTLVLYQDNDYHINGKQSTCNLHVSIFSRVNSILQFNSI